MLRYIFVFGFLLNCHFAFGQSLSELTEFMTGHFNSEKQSVSDTNYYNISLEMAPIWEDRTDGKWLYVEQAVATMKDKPYRQRVYHLKQLMHDKFVSLVYKINDEENFIGAWQNPEKFNSLTSDILTEREGCEVYLNYKDGVYFGSTNGKNCLSTMRGARYATSQVTITKNKIVSWDQGFDAGGKQVWGAQKGAYVFDNITAKPKTNLMTSVKTNTSNYPASLKGNVVDDFFGTKVADPYRWLEDEESAETKAWIIEQNNFTQQHLNQIGNKQKIKERLTQIWDYPKLSVPFKKAGNYFMYKNSGLENQKSLFIKRANTNNFEMLIDGNALSDDGTVSLSYAVPSPDGKYVAYAISEGGSDWKEFHIIDITTGKKLNDHLKWIKFSGINWYKDGFIYSRYKAPKNEKVLAEKNSYSSVYFHKIGTTQSEDVLLFEDPDNPEIGYGLSVTEDEQYQILTGWSGTHGNTVSIRKASLDQEAFTPIATDNNFNYWMIGSNEDQLYFITDYNAPNYKLVSVNAKKPKIKNWKDIIPALPYVMDNVKKAGKQFVVNYLKDVISVMQVFDLEGNELHTINTPAKGTISSINTDHKDSEIFYRFSSYLYPPTTYKCDVAKGEPEVYEKVEIDFDASQFETKQVFYTSKDGTKIPMFITHKKGLQLDGNNPTMLYGYGGFNISYLPNFDVSRLYFIENGGVYAVANLRGGGEYGEAWHQAGMFEKKQTVFDDFIAACEYLSNEKYTNPDKLAVIGRSNGGLLIGAMLAQRPDLFKVAYPVVGVLDMLRYHKFTIGYAWATEYGSSENEAQFNYLYKYSPLHNIKPNNYPAVMVLTADRDDRVVPAHSYKFIATLQENQQGELPTLIRIDTKAGHGSGKSTTQLIEEYTDIWSFAVHHLGMSIK